MFTMTPHSYYCIEPRAGQGFQSATLYSGTVSMVLSNPSIYIDHNTKNDGGLETIYPDWLIIIVGFSLKRPLSVFCLFELSAAFLASRVFNLQSLESSQGRWQVTSGQWQVTYDYFWWGGIGATITHIQRFSGSGGLLVKFKTKLCKH